ncbi:Heart- and neural crest derivatives-expressed protein 2 [Halotydeus destructor]|nr:Heart- and neural crest derivatives-expressed protein 2 [Halotydeus destructor]
MRQRSPTTTCTVPTMPTGTGSPLATRATRPRGPTTAKAQCSRASIRPLRRPAGWPTIRSTRPSQATISDGDSLDQQGQGYHPTPGRHSPEPKEGDYHGDHYIEPGSLVDYGHLDQDTEPKNPTKANKKERRRTVSINSAFSNLRDCIPNVPTDTKLSKIKTLRLATSYIGYLMALLDNGQENDQLCPGLEGFKVDLQRFKRGSKGENKALYQQKLLEEQERAKYMPRKGKGRTGWPQHVWADELKVQDGGNKRPN